MGRNTADVRRVLVVDDSAVNQKVAKAMLERFGCKVDLAANGREAVTLCNAQSYDLVLMDCEMPEMDGYEATREIRRQEGQKKHTPIVAATAMANARERCLAVGMDEHLSKPLTVEHLDAVLSRFAAAEIRIDTSAIEALRGLSEDASFLREIFAAFECSLDDALAQLRAALKNDDATALSRHAHTLKGSSRQLGATDVATICERLEAGDPEPARQVALLEVSAAATRKRLGEIVRGAE